MTYPEYMGILGDPFPITSGDQSYHACLSGEGHKAVNQVLELGKNIICCTEVICILPQVSLYIRLGSGLDDSSEALEEEGGVRGVTIEAVIDEDLSVQHNAGCGSICVLLRVYREDRVV